MPRVKPKAKKANTVLRSPYAWMVKSERQTMATLMAHYQRGLHKGRASGRGLALT